MITRFNPRRWRISPWAVLWLTVVWVMLWGEVTPVTVIGGALIATGVLLAFPLPHVRVRLRPRAWPLLVLISRYLYDLVTASIQVSWLAVRPGRTVGGVVMDMELVGDDELLQVLTAEMVTLVPGSVVIELDPVTRVLTIHALDVRTRQEAEEMRRRVRGQEARILRALHPTPELLLNPRSRRQAQRRAAEEGPVRQLAEEAAEQGPAVGEMAADEHQRDGGAGGRRHDGGVDAPTAGGDGASTGSGVGASSDQEVQP